MKALLQQSELLKSGVLCADAGKHYTSLIIVCEITISVHINGINT